MKKLYLLFIMMIVTLQVFAQTIEISDFQEKTNDLQARTNPRTDRNGNQCALVKVILPVLEGATFEGLVIDTKHVTGEYQVYVPDKTKRIKLRHSSIPPTEINFPRPVEGKHTYQVTVHISNKATNNTIARIVTNVKKANITIDDKIYETQNGEFNIPLSKGVHNYVLDTQIKGFISKSGSITINGNEIVENIPQINLSTNEYRFLTLLYEKGTKIKIDGNEIKKSNSGIIKLLAGIHHIEAYMGNGLIWYKSQNVDLTYKDETVNLSLRGNLNITYPSNSVFEIIPVNGALKPNKDKIKTGETAGLLGDYIIKVNKKNYSKSQSQISIGINDTIDNYRIDVKNKGDEYFYGYNNKKQNYTKAYNEYLKLAKQGDDIAQYKLGCCFNEGLGCRKDEIAALSFWRKSANQGNTYALIMLGKWTSLPQERLDCFKKAIKFGNYDAYILLGDIYFNGKGIKKNYNIALEYYIKSAQYHQENAYRKIGEMYYNGQGVERNVTIAREYFDKAVLEGDELALEYNINLDYENGKCDSAIIALKKLKNLSDKSLTNIALYHYKNHEYDKSAKFFQRVKNINSNLGSTIADLADKIYTTDKEVSISLYEKADALGYDYKTARRRIGIYYLKTDGQKAYRYLLKAEEMGDAEASCYIGYCYEKAISVAQNYNKAFTYYQKSASLNYYNAYSYIGTLYMNGHGTEKNVKKALYCWEKAAEKGSVSAINNLIKYYKFKRNYNQANKWEKKLKEKKL